MKKNSNKPRLARSETVENCLLIAETTLDIREGRSFILFFCCKSATTTKQKKTTHTLAPIYTSLVQAMKTQNTQVTEESPTNRIKNVLQNRHSRNVLVQKNFHYLAFQLLVLADRVPLSLSRCAVTTKLQVTKFEPVISQLEPIVTCSLQLTCVRWIVSQVIRLLIN